MRAICGAVEFPDGSVWYIAPTTMQEREQVCGAPAVEYQESIANGKKYWLCAKHWDQLRELP